MRWDVPVETGADTLGSVGMLVGWVVFGMTVGTCGVLVDASAPPERRLRRIWVMPEERGRLWDADGCMLRAMDRRLLEEGPGEGGEASIWGRGKRGGESRSITGEGYWDWEVPRGRPRKKEVRIFCLDGGESELTAWGKTPSMRRGPVVEEIGGVVEGREEIIKERVVPPLTVAGPTSQIPRTAQKPRQTGQDKTGTGLIHHTSQPSLFFLSLSLPLSLLYTKRNNVRGVWVRSIQQSTRRTVNGKQKKRYNVQI